MRDGLGEMFRTLDGRRAALIAYATAYYPDRAGSLEAIITMLESGADAVEIGVPFSDPVMDGPVIQAASRTALGAGATVGGVLELVSDVRARTDRPVVMMSYYNPVFRYGLSDFARDAAGAGTDALVVPDLPAEEMGPLKRECDAAGLRTVAFCSVTTTDDRIGLASSMSSGFLYCVAVLGTTGPRDELSPDTAKFMERVRARATCPLALGIGISKPEQCRAAGRLADGVIVGSALVNALSSEGPEGLGLLVGKLADSLRR